MTSFSVNKVADFAYNLLLKGEHCDPISQYLLFYISACFNDENMNSIFFTAEHVTTLKEYLASYSFKLSHYKCIEIIDELTNQFVFLEKLGYGFYGFNIEDILVINGSKFVICNSQFLLPISNNMLHFYEPINTPQFIDPHMFRLTTLPSQIHYKCVYYSLAVLIIFSLLNVYLLVGNEGKSELELERILSPIKNTKLYWFLKRSIDPNIEHRTCLLI